MPKEVNLSCLFGVGTTSLARFGSWPGAADAALAFMALLK
jgi:hypothetical protein